MFDPPFDIEVSDLRSDGYNYISDWSWYNKVDGDTAFIYQTNFEDDPIFARLVDIGNWKIRDSIEIKEFIELKHGTLVSPIHKSADTLNFFVQGHRSGLYSNCTVLGSHLTIAFYYPDHDGTVRSKYRKPTSDGFVTEIEKGKEKRTWRTK